MFSQQREIAVGIYPAPVRTQSKRRMQVARRERVGIMQRILSAQFIDPPLRKRIAPDLAVRGRREQCIAFAQKIAQHGVDKTARLRLTDAGGAADCMVDDRIRRRARELQLIKTHEQEPAQLVIAQWLRQQLREHCLELQAKTQRAITEISDRRALLRAEMRVRRPQCCEGAIQIFATGNGRNDRARKALGFKHACGGLA